MAAETKLKLNIYYTFRSFSIKLDYVMSFKYMYIMRQQLLNVMSMTVREFSVYAKLRTVNVDISVSLLRDYFIGIDGCLMYIGVNRSFYVPRR